MHLAARGRRTACGLDVRGQRSTRQASLVDCRDCKVAVVTSIVDRLVEHARGGGSFEGAVDLFKKP